MMRSMFSGVSGIRVHQTKMDVIANNISNVNTVGYKASRVTFSEVFSQTLSGASSANPLTGRGGVNPMQIGLGAGVASIDKIMTTGSAQRTDRTLDLMIQGEGFFIVGDGSGTYFTRAGALDIDENGNIVNVGGLKLMGWDAIEDTEKPGQFKVDKSMVKPLIITPQKEYISPKATSVIGFKGNLNARTDKTKDCMMTFYDSVGTKYVMDITFTHNPDATDLKGKDAVSAWEITIPPVIYPEGDRDNPIKLNADFTGLRIEFDSKGKIVFPVANDKGEFDGIDLTFVNPIDGLVPGATIGLLNPTDNTKNDGIIKLRFDGITQLNGTAASAKAEDKDGCAPGKLQGMVVSTDGKITGRYSNGQMKLLGQVPVARFSNPGGLEKIGDNLFAQTANSGDFDGIGEEIAVGGGKILGGVLEMANVDLSSEFTEMITTQRGFQANSRIITTSDEMLQELVNLKR